MDEIPLYRMQYLRVIRNAVIGVTLGLQGYLAHKKLLPP